LPRDLPDVPGWQLAVTLEPARETSGDFYDFIPLSNGRLGIVVADVADKGVGAALYMALSRTLIRTFAQEHSAEPEKTLAAANQRILTDTGSDLFVTVFYAILDPQTGVLTYCNAGHNPPFLLQSQNGHEACWLSRTALPLGLFEDLEWAQTAVEIMPGDVLVLYTDGVTEAQDEAADFFGEERLKAVARANLGRSAEIIESKMIAAVYDFVGDEPQFDDITLMIVFRET
jgi:sigma-B regulation protein RsbU (phosphoserine phosphatase)